MDGGERGDQSRGWIDALRACVDLTVVGGLAPSCAACHGVLRTPTRGAVCLACWARIEEVSTALRRVVPGYGAASTRSFDVIGAGPYQGPLERAITAFKYQGHVSLATPLAGLMRRAAPELLAAADAVVPVPLHPLRRWRRGFNQASVLAEKLGPPVWPLLARRSHAPPQASLHAGARRANVSGAFALRGTSRLTGRRRRPRHTLEDARMGRSALEGRLLVVVDDVCTTGSTLGSCMSLLVGEGADVVGLTVALVASVRLEPRPASRPPGRGDRPR